MTLSKRVLCLAIAAWSIAAGVGPASAKNVCLSDGANTLVFESPKKLKAGKSIALRGIYILDGVLSCPFDGSAIMRSDKSVAVGLFVHNAINGSNNFTLEWVTTATLAGNAPFDSDGDFRTSDDGTLSLSVVDCKTVAIP